MDKIIIFTFILVILSLISSIGVYQYKKETIVSLGVAINSGLLMICLIGYQVHLWNHPDQVDDPPITWGQFIFGMVILLYIAIFMYGFGFST